LSETGEGKPPMSKRWGLGIAATLLTSAAALVALQRNPVEESSSSNLPLDPRLEYDGPFRNIRPNVAYVGSEICGNCHAEIAHTYARHPMARSLVPIAEGTSVPEDAAHHLPFRAAGSQFSVVRRGKDLLHRRTWEDADGKALFHLDLPVRYIIGSGHHGHSYLSDRDGYVSQTPISWYAQKKMWDLSPGFEGTMLLGRPVNEQCLYCHGDNMVAVPGTVNRYRPGTGHHGIGCERCHGPGEKHVAAQADYTIVNPAKLPAPLREAVCQQCHLEGDGRVLPRGRDLHDFRPGLPLESCWSVFVEAGSNPDQHAVNQVRQMYESRCFKKSGARLGCISCHDPHRQLAIEERVGFYRTRCLMCHAEGESAPERTGCALAPVSRRRQNAQDSCIDCHMPRYSAVDVAHQAATDHRILRSRAKNEGQGGQGEMELVHFHIGPAAREDPERARDLGIAMVHLLAAKQLPSRFLDSATRLLDDACRRWPDDLVAWEEKAKALALQGRHYEAIECVQAVLARDSNRETSVVMAASLAQNVHRTDLAVESWKRAVTLNPWSAEYRGRLSVLLSSRGDWSAVQEHCQAWLRLDPGEIEARQLWILCLVKDGNLEQARAELRRIEHLKPSHLEQLKTLLKLPAKDR
jgi:hypothetical protein